MDCNDKDKRIENLENTLRGIQPIFEVNLAIHKERACTCDPEDMCDDCGSAWHDGVALSAIKRVLDPNDGECIYVFAQDENV